MAEHLPTMEERQAALREAFSGTPECSGFRRDERMLPSHDGVELFTVRFSPTDIPSPWPTVVQRSCYPHDAPLLETQGELYAKRGFAMVYQMCRGTGRSQGTWEPNVNERDDGLALMAWLQGQDWAGPIGYYGASYLALTGWAMADAVPDKVKTMFLSVYGTERHTSAWENGLFRQDILTAWAMGNAGRPVTADLMESCRYRPQVQVDEALWGGRLPWYRDWITHPDGSDPYWREGFWGMLHEIPGKVKLPVYVVDGWYDHHLGSALRTWENLSDAAKAHSRLEIYPGNHGFAPAIYGHPEAKRAVYSPERNALAWFTEILHDGHLPEPWVRYYAVGEDCWKTCPAYPFPEMGKRIFYLGDGTLDSEPGAAGERSYTYDPDNPVETLGAESLFAHFGSTGSREIQTPNWRPDVLSFLSEPLNAPVPVLGKPRVKLFVRSDAPDTCFTVKLAEQFPDGRSFHIRNGITTLRWRKREQAPQGYDGGMVELDLETWDIAWTLQRGSRLRIDISSSNFPEYSIHPNTTVLWSEATEVKTAHQTVFFGGDTPARVELPVDM